MPAAGMKMPRWELHRERSFAVRDGDVILSGTFDRLVVLYDGDRAVGADVLDYKIGRRCRRRPAGRRCPRGTIPAAA